MGLLRIVLASVMLASLGSAVAQNPSADTKAHQGRRKHRRHNAKSTPAPPLKNLHDPNNPVPEPPPAKNPVPAAKP